MNGGDRIDSTQTTMPMHRALRVIQSADTEEKKRMEKYEKRLEKYETEAGIFSRTKQCRSGIGARVTRR
jgi:hypothetical protein